MSVFISWSGAKSKEMAAVIKENIGFLVSDVSVFMSDQDIEAGDRWSAKVAEELNNSNFGILCLTKENLSSAWVMFEAGALSKVVSESSVVPLLLDLDFSDLTGPLTQFQAKKTTEHDLKKLFETIRVATESSTPSNNIETLWPKLWPDAEAKLDELRNQSVAERPSRNQGEILEELVGTVRSFDVHFREIRNNVSLLYGALEMEEPEFDARRIQVEIAAEKLGITPEELLQRQKVLLHRKRAEEARMSESNTRSAPVIVKTKKRRKK